MTIQDALAINGKKCSCGKVHSFPTDKIYCGKGVISKLADTVKAFGASKAYVVCDLNTKKAAGDKVISILEQAKLDYTLFTFNCQKPIPNEEYTGSAVLHFDKSCDIIIGVGSGVVNDISKILATVSSKPYIIVGTAPSMDGYASDSSSMERDGLKTSIPSKCADAIFGDTDILCNAPEKMLMAGLGDIIAKYTSLAEWKISNIINGEYHCETIADIIRGCLKDCTDNAEKLLKRDEQAVKAVFEALVITGMAMAYAGCSRPASGVEHYISHVWDMRGLSKGTPVDLHGIQTGIGSYITIKLFEKLKGITPDREKALEFVKSFSYCEHSRFLLDFIGDGANAMIRQEEKEQKYNLDKHRERLGRILDNWDEIIKTVKAEIPCFDEIDALYSSIGLAKKPSDIGIDDSIVFDTFIATKNIRDKYVLSRLAWDLGIEKELFM